MFEELNQNQLAMVAGAFNLGAARTAGAAAMPAGRELGSNFGPPVFAVAAGLAGAFASAPAGGVPGFVGGIGAGWVAGELLGGNVGEKLAYAAGFGRNAIGQLW